jgi:hypothetical protein
LFVILSQASFAIKIKGIIMTTLSLISGLPQEIRSLLVSQPPGKWVNILKNRNERVGTLFHSVVTTPGWKTNPLLLSVANEARVYLRDHKGELPKSAKSLYNKSKMLFKQELLVPKGAPSKGKKDAKKASTVGQENIPPAASATDTEALKKKKIVKSGKDEKAEGSGKDTKADKAAKSAAAAAKRALGNKGPVIQAGGLVRLKNVTCWMNTLVQHLRFTSDFESILTGPIHHLKATEKREDFENLQKCLNDVVTDIRSPTMTVEKAKLEKLLASLHTCNMINNPNRQQDASEVLSLLLSRFGHSPAGVEIYKIKHYAPGVETIESEPEAETDYLPLQTTKKGESIAQLIAQNLGVRNVSSDPDFRELYKDVSYVINSFPPLLQLRINKPDGNPEIEQWVDLKPHHRTKDTLPAAEVTTYGLEAAMCRSGAQVNVLQKKDKRLPDTLGHYWYLSHDDKGWVEYNDSRVTRLSQEAAQTMLNGFAYTLFYNKQPRKA